MRVDTSGWKSLAAIALASVAAGALGARINLEPRNKRWYRRLRKASFTPPDRAFGIVWPILYSLSALSAWRVARAPASRARTVALGAWSTQIVANGAWTPIFFGAHRPKLAFADLAANFASLGVYAAAARKIDRPAAVMVAPYLAWLTFAGVLNAAVIAKNPSAG